MDANVSQQQVTGEKHPVCGKCCGECVCCITEEQARPNPGLFTRIKEDVRTVFDKDPAARSTLEVLTCYPGLHAIWLYRVANRFWTWGWLLPARFISHVARWLTGIEIHPGATIGRRFFIDHGMGVVIGETAEIGNDVLMYKGVVLGGVSLEKKKRHPTIGNGVVLGTNAIVLGPILVGPGSKIGSGSVVIKEVPECATVVGIPGRVVKQHGVACQRKPDLHHERLPDMITDTIVRLSDRVEALEERLAQLESTPTPAADEREEEVETWA